MKATSLEATRRLISFYWSQFSLGGMAWPERPSGESGGAPPGVRRRKAGTDHRTMVARPWRREYRKVSNSERRGRGAAGGAGTIRACHADLCPPLGASGPLPWSARDPFTVVYFTGPVTLGWVGLRRESRRRGHRHLASRCGARCAGRGLLEAGFALRAEASKFRRPADARLVRSSRSV